MKPEEGFDLDSKFVGALPLVNRFLERLRIAQWFRKHLPAPDPRTKFPPEEALGVLLRNIILSRLPLYSIGEWARQFVPELLGLCADSVARIGDDRVGRALDRLFDADRRALLTDLVVHTIQTFQIDLSQLHNDSTTITLHGQYSQATGKHVRGKRTLEITHGHNKDHRPDLKQLLWILTISADGAVPVTFKVADGNVEDSTTHIETWKVLRELVGHPDFIYVADSKLCTADNLHFIHQVHSGHFVTVLPRSRKEDRLFKDWLQTNTPAWEEVAQFPHPRLLKGPPDIVRAIESPIPDANGFRLVWFHSSHKQQRDVDSRQEMINRAWKKLEAVQKTLEGPRCRYTTRAGVAEKAESLLEETGATRWLCVGVEEREEKRFRQEKRGRPGSKTRWRRSVRTRFSLTWSPIRETIEYDARTDGVFPLLTSRTDLPARELLDIYKSKQPFVEKRHDLLKNVLPAPPVFLNSAARIEAFLFLCYIALTVHALIERAVRTNMKKRKIESLPLYPEERDSKAPTTTRICEVFSTLQRHVLSRKGKVVQQFLPELSPIHKEILSLLDMSPAPFVDACRLQTSSGGT